MTKVSSSSFTPNASLERFLKKLPDEIVSSFSVEQLQAMQSALQTTQWRRHPIDIRFTLPLLWKKFYVVLVSGPEQRSQQRRQRDRGKNPVWTWANILFISSFISLGVVLSFGLFHFKTLSFDFLSSILREQHPAGIPFKPDQPECEKSGRIWQNNECIDYEHDPAF